MNPEVKSQAGSSWVLTALKFSGVRTSRNQISSLLMATFPETNGPVGWEGWLHRQCLGIVLPQADSMSWGTSGQHRCSLESSIRLPACLQHLTGSHFTGIRVFLPGKTTFNMPLWPAQLKSGLSFLRRHVTSVWEERMGH